MNEAYVLVSQFGFTVEYVTLIGSLYFKLKNIYEHTGFLPQHLLFSTVIKEKGFSAENLQTIFRCHFK
jgi:hypothetical protein